MSDATLLDALAASVPKGVSAGVPSTGGAPGLDRLLALEVPVAVCFGERTLALRDLAALAPGSILELDRGATAPVDLRVGEQVVARGLLVVVDDHYALRVTEVLPLRPAPAR